jgi:hypothetical protein
VVTKKTFFHFSLQPQAQFFFAIFHPHFPQLNWIMKLLEWINCYQHTYHLDGTRHQIDAVNCQLIVFQHEKPSQHRDKKKLASKMSRLAAKIELLNYLELHQTPLRRR